MKVRFVILATLCAILAGCVSSPVISKSKMGNLEINVQTLDKAPTTHADVYIDDVFIGNPSKELPVVHAKRGQRVIRVELAGFKPYERTIAILGDPNHQVLNIVLDKAD